MSPQPPTSPVRFHRKTCPWLLVLLWALWQPARADLRITEVLPEDQDVLADEDGDHSGWVELHNPGPQPVPLLGYGLSDDPSRPFRWSFPAVTLEAGARLVVFTSGKDRGIPAGPTNAAPAELSPGQITGLQWWIDAADPATLTVTNGQVALWQDKSGRQPEDEYPAPLPPANLSGKVLWLDAADAASFELSANTVARWRDRSGATNDAAQTAAAQRPTKATAPDGLPLVRFDGQDDVLNLPRDVTVQTLVWVGVESAQVPAADRRPLVGHATRFDYLRGSERALLGNHSGMAQGVLNAAVYLNGDRVNAAATELPPGLNVVIIAGAGPGVFNNLADDRALPRGRWWGDMAEVIGFNRTLSENEVLALDRHLRAKWQGVADSFPPDYSARQGHPEWRPKLAQDPLTGQPAVRFDGVDDRLSFAEVKRAQSLFLVVREDGQATDSSRPFLGHNSSYALARGYDGLLLCCYSPATWIDNSPVNPRVTRPPSRRMLLNFQFSGPVPFDSLAMDRVYDDWLFEGDVLEMALFNRALTTAERDALSAHFSRKWLLPDRRLHASFSLKEGEALSLTAPDGRRADAAPGVPVRADQAYGRLGDGPLWGWLDRPTPGAGNPAVGVLLGLTPAPTTLPAAGFLGGATPVQLLAATNSPADTRIYFTLDGSEPATGPDSEWLDDALPTGATSRVLNDNGWTWGRTNPVAIAGAQALQSGTVAGLHQFAVDLAEPFRTGTNGIICFELWCDPANPPRTVMFQARTGGSWEHRAYWGDDLIALGAPGTAGHRRMGNLPAPGRWFRLEFAAAELGLTNAAISNVAFTLFDGRAAFDALGYAQAPLPRLYGGPLNLAGSTVIRARAVAPGHLASETATASFLMVPAGNLPIVSLSAEPAGLFDETIGLYAAGPEKNADGLLRQANYQRNWERPVHAEFFEPDGSAGFSVDCGLKIHGAFSRHWPQKSLRLHFRQRYGLASLKYPVFPGQPVDRFDSLILRNSGNDWNRAYLRDELAHSLAGDLGLGHQAWRPAHAFINGQYWGVLTLREHATDDMIARQHGVADDLDIVKNESEILAGDGAGYDGLVFNAVSATGNPARQPVLAAQINGTNYLDWLGLEVFTGNGDWPGNNVLAWRQRSPGMLWNWMMLDCDGGFNSVSATGNTLRSVLVERALVGLEARSLVIMRGLLNSDDARRLFSQRLADRLNSTFATNVTLARLEQLVSVVAPAMPAQIERWKDSSSTAMPKGSALQSFAAWQAEVDDVRQFLRLRPAAFREHVRNFFALGADVALTVSAEPPEAVRRLRVGTLDFTSGQLPWAGTYFAGLPVELTVEAAPGFRVTGWSDGTPASASRLVTFSEALSLKALLSPDGSAAQPFPLPFPLANGPYAFTAWPSNSPAGTFPPSMAFETSPDLDPALTAAITGLWTNRYDLTSRSRVVGANGQGVEFVNTSSHQDGDGYVTGALLALDATGMKDLQVTWTGGTVVANARTYALRLQWRVGTNAPFADVLDASGSVVEYVRQAVDGHATSLGPVRLPPGADGQPLVQLRWRYHSVPQPGDSGARAQLRLDEIRVAAVSSVVTPTVAIALTGQTVVLTATGSAGSDYALWASPDLVQWTEQSTARADGAGRMEFPAINPGEIRFFQVRLR